MPGRRLTVIGGGEKSSVGDPATASFGLTRSVRNDYRDAGYARLAFAYLDVGIYGHPMYDGKTPGVKIGFYHPPDAALALQEATGYDIRRFAAGESEGGAPS